MDMVLTLTKGTGKFLERKLFIYVFLNRQNPDRPFSPHPDQTITLEGITPGINIEDVNGDGKGDLIFSSIKLGFWNVVKNLVSKRVNLNTSIYLWKNDHGYSSHPDFNKKTSYRIDLTHGIRLRGAWPTLAGDFTGDGHKDLLIAHDGEVTVYPKNQNGDLFSKPVSQSGVSTHQFMHVVDMNDDGRDDIIFYQKKRNGNISILLNTGDWEKLLSNEGQDDPATET